MTCISPSRDAPTGMVTPAGAASLADVLKQLQHIEGLSGRQRMDLRSAVSTVGRILGRPLSEIPASPPVLRGRLDAIAPASIGLTRGRWNNVRSLLRKALKISGIAVMPGRHLNPLSADWSEHMAKLPTRTLKIGLSRLAHFCSDAGVARRDVKPETFERFRDALEREGLLTDPRTVHREACRCWNMAAKTATGWPALAVAVPDYRQWYCLPWSTFPPGFKSDVEAMLAKAQQPDLLVETALPEINATTARHRRSMIRRIASAAVLNGTAPDRIQRISDLISPDVVDTAFRYFLARSGNQLTHGMHENAKLLWTLAKHWAEADEDCLKRLSTLKRKLAPERTGMTRKNRAMLRHFEDKALAVDLLKLPGRVFKEVGYRLPFKQRDAVECQIALAVGLLTAAPIRAKNLAAIDLDRSLIKAGKRTHLFVPAEDVKNNVEVEIPLPDHLVALLAKYVETVRPHLIRAPNDWLFPGEESGHKGASLVSTQIRKLTERRLGVRVTAHQFRHVAGFLYLRENPGGYEVVRQLLGHRSIQTTIEFYAGMEAIEAARHYDRTILGMLNDPPTPSITAGAA